MASIFDQAEFFKRDLLKRDKAAADRLTDAYSIAWKSIKKQLDALTRQMTEAKLRGEDISQAWLSRQARYLSLLRQVGEQLGKFAEIAGKEITKQQQKSIDVARADAERLLIAGAEAAGIEAAFSRLPKGAVENMVGFLGDGSPLKDLLDRISRKGGVLVALALKNGLIKGRTPAAMAREIRIGLNGSLAKALQIARNEINRAYRETSYQTYQANEDVLEGWIWLSSLSSRCCVACIALHGTFHELGERMKSHVCCRCTQVPAVKDDELKIQKGVDWFEKQPAKTQREIFNQESKYEAYRDGELKLEDFVGLRRDPDWGDSYEVLGIAGARLGEEQFPTEPERAKERPAPVIIAEEPGPRGIPVGAALKLPKKGNLAAVGRKVVDLINAIHGDGNLPIIEVKQNAAKHTNGTYYWHFGPLRPGMIKVSSQGDHPEMTLAHEIGHFLDHQGVGNPRNMETTDGTAFAGFLKAASESEAINRLNDQLHLRQYEYTLPNGKTVKEPVDRSFLQYLLRKQEIWARAYAQWIALRSQDPKMLEQVRKLRENIHPASGNSQWSDRDFEPIAREIDALMEKLEWRKS